MTQTVSKLATEYFEQFSNLPIEEQPFFIPTKSKAKGTVLCFHGFIAGPWQFSLLAEQLAQKGFDVYAPRLANHAFEDSDYSRHYTNLPQLGHMQLYLNEAEKFITMIESNTPIHLVGFSAGALIASHLATRIKTQSLTLISPFFGIKNKQQLLRVLQTAGRLSFIRHRLNQKILSHASERRFKSGTIKELRYSLGSVIELLNLADVIFQKGKDLDVPTHLLVSEADEVIDVQKALSFFEIINPSKKSKTILKKYQNAPHSMISALQNPDAISRHQAIQSIVAFCEAVATNA